MRYIIFTKCGKYLATHEKINKRPIATALNIPKLVYRQDKKRCLHLTVDNERITAGVLHFASHQERKKKKREIKKREARYILNQTEGFKIKPCCSVVEKWYTLLFI